MVLICHYVKGVMSLLLSLNDYLLNKIVGLWLYQRVTFHGIFVFNNVTLAACNNNARFVLT